MNHKPQFYKAKPTETNLQIPQHKTITKHARQEKLNKNIPRRNCIRPNLLIIILLMWPIFKI